MKITNLSDMIDVTVMKYTVGMNNSKGFALPTVLIASVVMLMVLLSGLVSASSVNVALRNQIDQRLLAEAVTSGRAMAEECIKQNQVSWTNLYPGGSCNPGSNICPTSGAPSTCFVADNGLTKSTFKVGPLTTDAQGVRVADVEASLRTYRNSTVASGVPVKTEASTTKVKITIKAWKDLELLAGGACGLSYESIVYCWGVSNGGQLGNGLTNGTAQPLPTAIKESSGNASPLRFQSILSGADGGYDYSNVCGLTLDRKIYCWGRNSYGQHGTGDGTINNSLNPNPHPYPVRTVAGENETNEYDSFSMGPYHVCGYNSPYNDGGQSNRIYCWGWNGLYQLGTGNTTHSTSPKMSINGWNYNKVITGAHHTCGMSGTAIYCWGLRPNSGGSWSCYFTDTNQVDPNGVTVNCSDNGEARGTIPQTTDTGMTVNSYVYEGERQIISGADGVCAIDTSNLLKCFGANFYGQLGDGAAVAPYGGTYSGFNRAAWSPDSTSAVRNTSGTLIQFKDIAIGGSTCGLDMAGAAWCWGFGYFGSVGDGTALANRSRAVQVLTPAGGNGIYRKLFAGAWHMCALDYDNKVWCWGRKYSGNLPCTTNYCTTGPVLTPQFIRDPPNSITY